MKAGSTTTVVDMYGVTSSTAAADGEFKGKGNLIAANYTIGDFKVTYHNISAKKDFQGLSSSTSDITYKASVWGGTYALGNTSLFGMIGNGSVQTDGTATRTNDLTTSQYGIRYMLGKRTTAYLMNGVVKDKVQTSSTAAAKGTVTAMGLAHTF